MQLRITDPLSKTLVAEQQFRRIIGYRDLAKLAIAVERHSILETSNNVTHQEQAEPVTVPPSTREERRQSSTTIRASSHQLPLPPEGRVACSHRYPYDLVRRGAET